MVVNTKDLKRSNKKPECNHCWNKNDKMQGIPPEHRTKKTMMEIMRKKEKDVGILVDWNKMVENY